MELYIGIDPSINSTGVCLQIFDNDKLVDTLFYIVKPNNLNKKEQKIQDSLDKFKYICYDKTDLSLYKGKNYWEEYYKTLNFCNIVDKIEFIIENAKSKYELENIYIMQEGISYGSTLRTKSVFDLAGLNFMIRSKFIRNENLIFYIATPAEIKKFATGKGNSAKNIIVDIFKIIHPELSVLPKIDDIADAYFMCNYSKYIIENN